MNPLASAEPWDLVSNDYDEYVRPLFRAFSQRALELAAPSDAGRVLDVACGPGTTTELLAAQGHEVDAVDFSPAMLARLKAKLDDQGRLNGGKVRAAVMDGQKLEFDNNRFTAAFSMFGLMFFPDRARGFRELHRVLRPGAKACVSSWLPLAEVPAMQWVFGAFGAITPPPPKDAPPRQPVLEDPEVFRQELEAEGFVEVKVERHSAPMPVGEIDELWAGMVRSSAPIALFRKKTDDATWSELNARAIQHLRDNAPADLTTLTMEAWLAVGTKPA